MNRVAEKNGVLYVNDSKATNADSAAKALDTYDSIYWIVGGMAKAGGIASLTAFFPKIKKTYVIGQDAAIFAETLQAERVPYVMSETLNNAIIQARADAESAGGGVVLLSPAAASFDQFTSFEHRGDVFVAAVA
jgi:UDP-N-acetylmuramoylalanine--D-glutamate ligase